MAGRTRDRGLGGMKNLDGHLQELSMKTRTLIRALLARLRFLHPPGVRFLHIRSGCGSSRIPARGKSIQLTTTTKQANLLAGPAGRRGLDRGRFAPEASYPGLADSVPAD